MTQPMHKQLRAIGELLKLDCGDNSCLAAAEKMGMRTNGGCRCDFVGAVAELLKRTENAEGALGSWILDERNRLHTRLQELEDTGDWLVATWRGLDLAETLEERIVALAAVLDK